MTTANIYHGGSSGRKNFSSAGAVDTDIKAAVSVADTTANFLDPKIAAGAGIVKTILNPGANEQLEISAPGSTTDQLVGVTVTDTTPDFLGSKMSFVNLTPSVLNPGGDENLQVTAAAPDLSKISAADTTADFMDPKIAAGSGIVTTILNPGANEQLEISAPGSTVDEKVGVSGADTTPSTLNNKLVFTNLTPNILNPGGDESLEIVAAVPDLIRISINDNVADFLSGKLLAGTGIVLTILNPSGDEDLEINVPDLGKSLVSANDTDLEYLDDSLTVDSTLTKTIINPAGAENLQLKVTDPGKSLISSADTTIDYLENKIVAGSNITLTKLNPGGDEDLEIAASGGGDSEEFYTLMWSNVGALSVNALLPAPGGTWAGNGQGYYIGDNMVLLEVHVLVNRYVSFAGGQTVSFNLRRVSGAGTATSMITGASGTSVQTTPTQGLQNSGGGFRYYGGGVTTGLNIAIPLDVMLFCRCSGRMVNSATGATVWALLKKDVAP